jgi:hypothetical protein
MGKSRKTELISLRIAVPDCERKTLKFRLSYACKRVFQHFQPKKVCKNKKKKRKNGRFVILEILCV